jgi:hypothetical protein
MRQLVIRLLICATGVFAASAFAKSATIAISIEEVDAYTGQRGDFYVVGIALPDDMAGKRLDGVFLEFAVDAAPLSLEDSVASPVVGVFPLSEAFVGRGSGDGPGQDADPVFESTVPSVRPVRVGVNRVLKMDITDIVKGWMNEPESNHGLVIGALTGPEVGIVALKDELPGSESAIRVTFLYQNRFGDRISERQ